MVGTDARQAAAGRVLERAGYAVGGAEQVALADYILLPLPLDAARTPLAELLRAAKPGAVALGGRLSVQAKTIAQEAGVELVDYFARPELTVYNAIPTAEGCIGILLAERTRTLWGTNLLLLGFGPVGQALGARLAALGVNVTVCARRAEQRALAESLWFGPPPTVVNTIPAPVLTEPVLAALRPGSLIVDLASKPGGTDFAAAQRLGCKAIHALSLPAACAPDTAGEAVARTVLTILREREEHMSTQKKGRIAFAVCGSFCTLEAALAAAQQLTEQGWELLPIMSFAAKQDTRFGTGQFWQERLEALTSHAVLDTLQAVEPLGPKNRGSGLGAPPPRGAPAGPGGGPGPPDPRGAKGRGGGGAGGGGASTKGSTAWAHRGRTWPGSTSASTIILCPTGRMTPPTSPTA